MNQPTPGSSPGSASNRVHREAQAAREAAGAAAADAKHEASNLAQEVKQRAEAAADEEKSALADLVRDIGDAVQSAAGELGSRNQAGAAEYATAIGSGLSGISATLRKKDIGDIVSDVTSFARQHPAAYIGSAMLVGIALARFAVASPPANGQVAKRSAMAASGPPVANVTPPPSAPPTLT